jgi:tetratricopeptide (TPR) repeat protein
LEQLLAAADAGLPSDVRAQAYFFAGFLHWYLANYAAAMPHLQNCMALWQAPQHVIRLTYAQVFYTQMQAAAGQISSAESMVRMDAYAQVFRAAHDDWGLSIVLGRAGSTALAEKDLGRAMRYYEEAYAARQRSGLMRMWASSLNNLGFTALCQYDFDRAKQFLQQAVAFGERYNRTESVLMAQCNLGHIQFLQGDARAALEIFKACVVRHQELGIRDHLVATLAGIAYATAALEITPRSCVLFGAVSRQMEDFNIPLWWNERAELDAGLDKLKRGLDGRTFAAAWAQGQAMSLAQTIELALG